MVPRRADAYRQAELAVPGVSSARDHATCRASVRITETSRSWIERGRSDGASRRRRLPGRGIAALGLPPSRCLVEDLRNGAGQRSELAWLCRRQAPRPDVADFTVAVWCWTRSRAGPLAGGRQRNEGARDGPAAAGSGCTADSGTSTTTSPCCPTVKVHRVRQGARSKVGIPSLSNDLHHKGFGLSSDGPPRGRARPRGAAGPTPSRHGRLRRRDGCLDDRDVLRRRQLRAAPDRRRRRAQRHRHRDRHGERSSARRGARPTTVEARWPAPTTPRSPRAARSP